MEFSSWVILNENWGCLVYIDLEWIIFTLYWIIWNLLIIRFDKWLEFGLWLSKPGIEKDCDHLESKIFYLYDNLPRRKTQIMLGDAKFFIHLLLGFDGIGFKWKNIYYIHFIVKYGFKNKRNFSKRVFIFFHFASTLYDSRSNLPMW